MKKSVCKECKEKFFFFPSDQKGVFCSYPCYWRDMKKRRGKETSRWKGVKVGYHALHVWVTKTFGRPKSCEKCQKKEERKNYIHWANKTGKYLRERSDWIRLCASCHKKYDWKEGLERNKKGQFTKLKLKK